jgi:hypothetical protein
MEEQKTSLENYLRDVVPCIDTDNPFYVEQYEHALREWLARPAWEREAAGFAASVSCLDSLALS